MFFYVLLTEMLRQDDNDYTVQFKMEYLYYM